MARFETYRVRLLDRRITKIYNDELAGSGLTALQFLLLGLLQGRRGCSIGQLATLAYLSTSATSRNLRIMRNRGWLLDTSNGDARRRAIQVTAEGLRIWREALPCWKSAQRRAAIVLGPEAWRALSVVVGLVH